MSHTSMLIFSEDIFSDSAIANPYPVYAKMRAQGQIVWLETHKIWAAVGYQAAADILRQSKIFISGRGLSLNDKVNQHLIGSTLNSDGERHRRQRRVTATAILPDKLEELAPFIHKAADDTVKHLVQAKRCDGVADFARILPLSIVTELIGLPASGKQKMLEWAEATFNLFEGFNERSDASFKKLVDLQHYLKKHGTADQLEHGGLAKRIFEQAPEHGFSPEEASQMMRDYINPSLDTTISAAAFMLYYLATEPEQWDRLRADPDLISNAVEEIVRLTTPIRGLSRFVAEDTEICGIEMKEGQRVLVLFASANRDEAIFPEPDKFDVTRKTHRHMGFGQGIHMCMGMHLARMELQQLLSALIRHVDSIELAGEAKIAMNNTIRGLSSLPVILHPQKAGSYPASRSIGEK